MRASGALLQGRRPQAAPQGPSQAAGAGQRRADYIPPAEQRDRDGSAARERRLTARRHRRARALDRHQDERQQEHLDPRVRQGRSGSGTRAVLRPGAAQRHFSHPRRKWIFVFFQRAALSALGFSVMSWEGVAHRLIKGLRKLP